MKSLSLICIVILSSCSASWHIRTAMRKDSSLFARDTLIQIDTFKREVPSVSTVFKWEGRPVEITIPTDTIRMDSVVIRYLQRNDSIFIEADCPDCDEIIRTETITETIVLKPTFWDKVSYSIKGIIGAIALVFVGFAVVRLAKK